ncbi:uncharacterized protein LOC117170562 [Belonocnema kinseyi]|uniref:uncharacterized protein LOC117170562 n=1 Tax=Belonocnema kinseyi TaxID=2817044 RepID=UPI00143DBCCE|nr:uncharacterized protein LOC117170562 [Belonocnema kinseyi]
MIRSIAYLLRWKNKGPLPSNIPDTGRSRRGIRYLTLVEIAHAELLILRLIQREKFSAELKLLEAARTKNPNRFKGSFKSQAKFDELNPFIDDDGLIRVGSRLKHSDLLFNQKHPVLLPSNHHVSDLIIRDAHHRNFHGAVQSTLYAVRERFWILNGKNQIRHCRIIV